MTPNPKQEGQRWVTQARNDLRGAAAMRAAGLHNLACFHAQQTAEKALKAVLYTKGGQQILGHGVADLEKAVAAVVPETAAAHLAAGRLDQYYIPTRYPNGLPSGTAEDVYGPTDSDGAIHIAEQVLAFAETTIRRLLGQ